MELRIVTIFTDNYLMGDGDGYFLNTIYLAAFDDMGVEYEDEETLGKFDVELVSYELPQPIENSFVIGGFPYCTTKAWSPCWLWEFGDPGKPYFGKT